MISTLLANLVDDSTDNTDTTESQPQHTISESKDKIVLKTDIKRGTGTRDQDKIKVKVKGNDPEATVDKLDAVLHNMDNVTTQARQLGNNNNEE
jgi:hypothetical protein